MVQSVRASALFFWCASLVRAPFFGNLYQYHLSLLYCCNSSPFRYVYGLFTQTNVMCRIYLLFIILIGPYYAVLIDLKRAIASRGRVDKKATDYGFKVAILSGWVSSPSSLNQFDQITTDISARFFTLFVRFFARALSPWTWANQSKIRLTPFKKIYKMKKTSRIRKTI